MRLFFFGMQEIIVQSLAGVGPDLFDTNANNLPVIIGRQLDLVKTAGGRGAH
nr:hypothetical protein [Armatimonas sp.]